MIAKIREAYHDEQGINCEATMKEYNVPGKNSTVVFSDGIWKIKRFPDNVLVGCYSNKKLALYNLQNKMPWLK